MGIYSSDLRPIEEGCECECCQNYTRAALHLLFRSNQSVAASILSIHNLYHQKRLMTEMREAIIAGISMSKNVPGIYGFCLDSGIRSLAKLPLFSRYVSSMG